MIHYDEVTTARELEPPVSGPLHVRASGHAVEIDQHWIWFPAIEPASSSPVPVEWLSGSPA